MPSPVRHDHRRGDGEHGDRGQRRALGAGLTREFPRHLAERAGRGVSPARGQPPGDGTRVSRGRDTCGQLGEGLRGIGGCAVRPVAQFTNFGIFL